MTGDLGLPELERVAFFDGQLLTAADLTEAQRVVRELRWLHTRGLHGWGIALGLAVRGRKGDSRVTLAPGYAVDCRGREILLRESRAVTVPAVAGEPEAPRAFYLTIAYPEDDGLVPTARRAGVCAPGGAVRLDEVPRVRWVAPEDPAFRPGLDVVLAEAWVRHCRLARPLSLGPRRSARAAARPHLAAGRTEPGGTRWDWIRVGGVLAGMATVVDTSAGRFHATPTYQAHVLGTHVIGAAWVIHGPVRIDDATPHGFRLEVLLPPGFSLPGGVPVNPPDELARLDPAALGWSVAWLGVEAW